MKKAQAPAGPAIRLPAGIPGLPQPPVPVYPGVAGMLLLIHTVLSLVLLLARQIWRPLQDLVDGQTLRAFVLGGILMQGLLILLPALAVLLQARIPAIDLLGARANAGSLILAVTAGIPAAVVFQGLNNLLIYLLVSSGLRLPEPSASIGLSGFELLRQPWPVLLLVLLVSIITPGLVEELFFRGILLSSLSSRGATTAALFWQAAAFALFHADLLFLLPPFLAGLLLGYVRRRSGSLWPAMLTHMSLNLSLIALNPLLPRLTAQYLAGSSQQAVSLLYASLIAACIAAVAFVPLLVLIGNLQPRADRPAAHMRLFPGDWKFALAFALQIATIFLFPS